MTNLLYHKPVLLSESIDALCVKPDGVYADVTFGGGGHSQEILNRLGDNGKLFVFDKDQDAFNNVPKDSRLTFIRSDFRFAYNFLRYYNALPLDGIIADLGLSSHHIDEEQRGFSFRFQDSELDMRMDVNVSKTARLVVNTYSSKQLAEMFYKFGELKNSSKIANAIVRERENSEIIFSRDLLSVLEPYSVRGKENQFYAKVFQALRIEVNEELLSLRELLTQLPEILKPLGRAVIISYHSLEDRLVKNFFKSGNLEGILEKDFFGKVISTWMPKSIKAVVASDTEIAENNRARSAKLRFAIKN